MAGTEKTKAQLVEENERLQRELDVLRRPVTETWGPPRHPPRGALPRHPERHRGWLLRSGPGGKLYLLQHGHVPDAGLFVGRDAGDAVRAQLDTLREALDRADAEILRREAHAIKGGAANLAAAELSSAAAELEITAKSGSLGAAPEGLVKLERAYRRLDEFVHKP